MGGYLCRNVTTELMGRVDVNTLHLVDQDFSTQEPPFVPIPG